VYVAFQELATRVAHRNTGRLANDPVADRLLTRIATDENLHMVFYRDLIAAALELAPDQTLGAIAAGSRGSRCWDRRAGVPAQERPDCDAAHDLRNPALAGADRATIDTDGARRRWRVTSTIWSRWLAATRRRRSAARAAPSAKSPAL
jgi:hypothetical protein